MTLFSRLRRQGRDRGAALVEFVLVAPILALLLLGTAELGLAFRDWLTVTSASRSGARVGSAAGNAAGADAAILDAVETAMSAADFSAVSSVWVYALTPAGQRDPARTNVYDRVDGGCGWNPCPGGGVPWPSGSRNVALGSLDTLGVRVNFTHSWLTGILGLPDGDWADDAVMRLEPQEF